MDDAVYIPSKITMLNADTAINTEGFYVSRNCVSVNEFSKFAEAADYRTLAELHGGENFRDNVTLANMPTVDRGQMPAAFVSFLDALAYCNWMRCRVPTEEEWIAAAVCVPGIITEKEAYVRYCKGGIWRFDGMEVLNFAHYEWTGTENGSLVVTRGGPHFYVTPDYKSSSSRSLKKPSFYSAMLSFRVAWDQ